MHTLKEKTHVNADSTKVVPEGSAEAAFLLGLAGDEISDETAQRLGLVATNEDGDTSTKTKKEIAAELDAAGIEYPAKATKAELEELLAGNVGESAAVPSDVVSEAGIVGTAEVASTEA